MKHGSTSDSFLWAHLQQNRLIGLDSREENAYKYSYNFLTPTYHERNKSQEDEIPENIGDIFFPKEDSNLHDQKEEEIQENVLDKYFQNESLNLLDELIVSQENEKHQTDGE